MELIATVLGLAHTILSFLVVLSIVVFVHEFGHYIVGRWCGIRAEEFSIGFWKEIYGWTDKRGTRWKISVLPLGGYVKFLGDNDPASAGKTDDALTAEENAASFHGAKLWKRAVTVAAGPVANFILSILVFAGLTMWEGQPSQEPVIHDVTDAAHPELNLEAGDRILSVAGTPVESFGAAMTALSENAGVSVPVELERNGRLMTVPVFFHRTAIVFRAPPGGRALENGVESGDVILRYNGTAVRDSKHIQLLIAETELRTEITMTLRRGDEVVEVAFTPDVITREHPVTEEKMPLPTLGIFIGADGGVRPEMIGVGPGLAIADGAYRTWGVMAGTLSFFRDLALGQADMDQIGGPIRIAQVSGQAADSGLETFIRLIALISTAIGFLNLMPIPVLDGGHLVFYAAEAVRGKPLGERWLNAASLIGLTLVLCLMAFATYNDITRF